MTGDPLSVTDRRALDRIAAQRLIGLEHDAAVVSRALIDTPWAGRDARRLLPRFTTADAKAVGPALSAALPELHSGIGIANVAGAFTSAAATPWASDVLDQFERTGDAQARWQLGSAVNAMSVRKLSEHVPQLIRILATPRYGRSREMLAVALPRIGTEPALDFSLELLGDEVVAGHVLHGLAKAHAEVPRHLVEPFLADKRPDARRSAKKLLDR